MLLPCGVSRQTHCSATEFCDFIGSACLLAQLKANADCIASLLPLRDQWQKAQERGVMRSLLAVQGTGMALDMLWLH